MSNALPNGLILFNQRLLASHSLSEAETRRLWQSIAQQASGNDDRNTKPSASEIREFMGDTDFERSLAISNAQLAYCGVEIVSVVMRSDKFSSLQDNDNSDQENNQNVSQPQRHKGTSGDGHRKSTASKHSVRHYAIVNTNADEISRKSFSNVFPTHFYPFIAAVMHALVSESSMSRNALINLRNTNSSISQSHLTSTQSQTQTQPASCDGEPSAGKLKVVSLSEAEQCLEQLVSEKWLMAVQNSTPSNSDTPSQSSKKRTLTHLTIAPRTFMELSYVLVDQFGLEKEELPQQIYYRL
jgi:hypothetical protein